jgi:DNA-binding IclR family transcriptional regulator
MGQIQKSGVKSIEVGARLLRALVETRHTVSLKSLAAMAGMPPSKARRYLVSFIETGLVRQDSATRHYLLGEMALQIGIAAIGRYDPLTRAIKVQGALCDQLDKTVVLSVWGSHGPVTVNVEESSHPIIMTMKVGATLPMLATAAGLIFGAFLPRIVTSKIIKAELRTASNTMPLARTKASVDRLLASVKKDGIATNRGHLIHGVGAIAAPLLNSQDQLIAVMSVIGREESLDMQPNSDIANQLRTAAREYKDWPAKGAPANSDRG